MHGTRQVCTELHDLCSRSDHCESFFAQPPLLVAHTSHDARHFHECKRRMKARGVVVKEEGDAAPLVVVVWMAAGFESSETTKLRLILLTFDSARKTEISLS